MISSLWFSSDRENCILGKNELEPQPKLELICLIEFPLFMTSVQQIIHIFPLLHFMLNSFPFAPDCHDLVVICIMICGYSAHHLYTLCNKFKHLPSWCRFCLKPIISNKIIVWIAFTILHLCYIFSEI